MSGLDISTKKDKKIVCNFCNGESEVFIEGNGTYICNNCIELCMNAIKQDKKNPNENNTDEIEVKRDITPKTIKSFLDDFIIGQDEAKTIISVAVYNHYKRINNINSETVLDKSNILLLGPSGTGKAQPLDAKIKIPNGWKCMGDIQKNDVIVTPEGNTSKVLDIFPQGKKDIYKIVFEDGRTTECCLEHLWNIYFSPDETTSTTTSTQELIELLSDYSVYVDLITPEYKEDIYLPIEPISLGNFLGNYDFETNFVDASEYKKSNLYHNRIDKFVPDMYISSSNRQKKDLLESFMNSSCVIIDDKMFYYTSYNRLAKDFQYIVRSLGGICSIKDNDTSGYLLEIKMKEDVNSKIKMVSIEYVGEKEARCILIEDEKHLYVTDDFIVTHNTLIAQTVAEYLDVPFVTVDASSLTASAYVGDDVDTMVEKLYKKANNDVSLTEKGIIFIDECFPGDTEVMTDKGFVSFKNIVGTEKILQWNDDASMTFVNPERIVKNFYEGKIIDINVDNTLNHISTPNHNRVFINQDDNSIFKLKANETADTNALIPINGNYVCEENLSCTSELLSFYTLICLFGKLRYKNILYIVPRNKDFNDRIENILRRLNIDYELNSKNEYKLNTKNITFPWGNIVEFDWNFLLTLSLKQRQYVLKELSAYYNEKNPLACSYSLSNTIEQICYISGFTSVNKPLQNGNYSCYVIEGLKTLPQQNVIVTEKDYKNHVFCVTVKSGMIMIRQNGKIQITGNCDKISKKTSGMHTKDPSGEGVQQELLKLIEGKDVVITNKKTLDSVTINTKNILFIAGGAFVGIDKIVEERLNKKDKGIGFGAKIQDTKTTKITHNNVDNDDLISFGMIPELIGRIPIIAPLHELSDDQLRDILSKPKNSIVKQFKHLFEMENIDLKFSEKTLNHFVTLSKRKKTGVRGLRSIIEKELTMLQYELPDISREGIKHIYVDIDGYTKDFKKLKRKLKKDVDKTYI